MNNNIWLQLAFLFGALKFLDAAEKCYDIAGCFEVPKLWFMMPDSTEHVMTFAYYYDRNHREGIKFKTYPDLDELKKLPFRKERKTFVIIHGHTDNSKMPWITGLKDAILNKVNGQIITPDYFKGANSSFFKTCSNLPLVGRLIRVILDELGTDPQKLHIIGHSCGGQAASFTCKDYKNGDRKVKQLTILDSPVRLMVGLDLKADISKNDAEFVDAYHSHNGREAVGHMDIYFNGGIKQPPCEESIHNYSSKASCCHHMSHDYYVSSVQNSLCFKLFPATLNKLATLVPFKAPIADMIPLLRDVKNCGDECMQVGLHIDKNEKRGAFMIVTSEFEPYCTPNSAFTKYGD